MLRKGYGNVTSELLLVTWWNYACEEGAGTQQARSKRESRSRFFRNHNLKTTIMSNNITLKLAACAVLACGAAGAEVSADSINYDKIWNAPIVKKLGFTGRLQGDAYHFDGEGKSNDDLAWRRFRVGLKKSVESDVVLHSEMDLNIDGINNWDDFYLRLTDTYVGWNPSSETKFKFGKQSAGFTLDGSTSSKSLIVPERNIVAGNLWFGTEYFTGASVGGDIDIWSYKAGVFSSSGEAEFGHFDAGYFGLFSIGQAVGEDGSWRLDYVYNDPDYSTDHRNFKGRLDVGTADHEHVLAFVYKQMINESLGIWADIATSKGVEDSAFGVDQSDLLGFSIKPFYNFSDKLQLVVEYASVTSLDDEQDVRLARYAARNDAGRVETAHNLLLGFNWFLYDHKLKWHNAVEYNYGDNQSGSGDNYIGYGLTSAFRISW